MEIVDVVVVIELTFIVELVTNGALLLVRIDECRCGGTGAAAVAAAAAVIPV